MLVAEKPKMTVAELQQKLQQNDWWLVRAIERLHSFQTHQEQNAESTLEDNGVGFGETTDDVQTLAGLFGPDDGESLAQRFMALWLGNAALFTGLHSRKLCIRAKLISKSKTCGIIRRRINT